MALASPAIALLNSVYDEGLNGPNNLGTVPVNLVTRELTELINARHAVSYQLNTTQIESFKRWSGDHNVSFSGFQVTSHPLLRAAHDYLQKLCVKMARECNSILLIGSNYAEHKFFMQNTRATIYSFVGDMTARDEARNNKSVLYAMKDFGTQYDDLARSFVERRRNGNFEFIQENQKWPLRKVDLIIAIDSLYDISPTFLIDYMNKISVRICLFTMHMCAEMYVHEWHSVRNKTFETKWTYTEKFVTMQFENESSLSYVHKMEIHRDWSTNMAYSTNGKKAFWEPVLFNDGYGLFTLNLSTKREKFHMLRFYSSVNQVYRIFDVTEFLKYGNKKEYFVDKEKYDLLERQFVSLKNMENQAQTMADFMKSLMSPVMVGGKTLSKSWDLFDVPFIKILEFLLLQGSLVRGEVFSVVKEVGLIISSDKYGFGKGFFSDMKRNFNWKRAKFARRLDKFLKNTPKLVEIINSYMRFEKDYDFNSFKSTKKEIEILPFSELMKFVMPDNRLIEEFKTEILEQDLNTNIFPNHAAVKLSDMLSRIEAKKILHIGVEPGGMMSFLTNLGNSVTSILFVENFQNYPIHPSNIKNLFKTPPILFETWRHMRPNFKTKYDLLLTDTACCGDHTCVNHPVFVNDAFDIFQENKISQALIKITTFEFERIFNAIYLNQYKYEFLRSEKSNAMSMETYLYLKKRTNVAKIINHDFEMLRSHRFAKFQRKIMSHLTLPILNFRRYEVYLAMNTIQVPHYVQNLSPTAPPFEEITFPSCYDIELFKNSLINNNFDDLVKVDNAIFNNIVSLFDHYVKPSCNNEFESLLQVQSALEDKLEVRFVLIDQADLVKRPRDCVIRVVDAGQNVSVLNVNSNEDYAVFIIVFELNGFRLYKLESSEIEDEPIIEEENSKCEVPDVGKPKPVDEPAVKSPKDKYGFWIEELRDFIYRTKPELKSYHITENVGDGYCIFRSLATIYHGSQDMYADLSYLNDDLKKYFGTIADVGALKKEYIQEIFSRLRVGCLVIEFKNGFKLNTFVKSGNKNFDGYVVIVDNHCWNLTSPNHKYIRKPPEFDFDSIPKLTIALNMERNYNEQMHFLVEAASHENFVSVPHHVEAIKTFKTRISNPRYKLNIRILDAAAGSGKTHFAAQTAIKRGPRKTLYIASSRVLKEEYDKKIKCLLSVECLSVSDYPSKTFFAAFANRKKENFVVPNPAITLVIVDECFRHVSAVMMAIANFYMNAEVLLIGDKDQMNVAMDWYPNFTGNELSLSQLLKNNKINVDSDQVYHSRVSRRFGSSTVMMIKKLMRNDFELYSCYNHSTELHFVKNIAQINNICEYFTTLSLSGDGSNGIIRTLQHAGFKEVITISSSQGLTRENIVVLVDHSFNHHLAEDWLYVALSRHTRRIIFLDVTDDLVYLKASVVKSLLPVGGYYKLQATLENVENKGFNRDFFKYICSTAIINEGISDKKYEPMAYSKPLTSKNFNYDVLKYLMGLDVYDEGSAESMYFQPDSQYMMRLRGEKAVSTEFVILRPNGLVTGKRHFQKSFIQTVNTFLGRLADSKMVLKHQLKFSDELKEKVNECKKKFFSMYIESDKYELFMNDRVLDAEITKSFNEFATVLNITQQDVNLTYRGIQNILKGHLKQQIKSKTLDAAFKNKGGQPVAAMEKAMNIMFSIMFRVMGSMIKKCLKDNFLIADNLSDKEVCYWIKEKFGSEFYSFESDMPQFDASQSYFTSLIEIAIWNLFSYDSESLKFYFLLRSNSKLKSIFFNTFWSYMRPSGAVDTMIGNILINMLIFCMIFKKEDVMAAGFKGDDNFAKLRTKTVDMDMSFFDMVFKEKIKIVTNQNTVEFCNYVFGYGHYVYNPQLFVQKITNKNYASVMKSEETFDEFNDSLKTIVEPIRLNFPATIKILISRYGYSIEQAIVILENIEAFARIPYKRFAIELNLNEQIVCDTVGGRVSSITEEIETQIDFTFINNLQSIQSFRKTECSMSSIQKSQEKNGKKSIKREVKKEAKVLKKEVRNQIKPMKAVVKNSLQHKRSKLEQKQQKLPKSIATVVENITLPATSPVCRLSTSYASAPTAVAAPWARIETDLGEENYAFAAAFRDPVRNAVIYSPAGSEDSIADYQIFGFNEGTNTPKNNWVMPLQSGSDTPIPFRYGNLVVGSGNAHGPVLYFGKRDNKPDNRYFWANPGDVMSLTYTVTPETKLNLWAAHESGDKMVIAYDLVANADNVTRTVTFASFGYYTLTIEYNSGDRDEADFTVNGCYFEVNAVNGCYRHLSLPDFEKNIYGADAIRLTGLSFMFTSTASSLNNGGEIAMVQAAENTHWPDYAGGTADGIANKDSFSPISKCNGSAALNAKNGMFGFLKPTKPTDFDFIQDYSSEKGVILDTCFPVFSKTAFLVQGIKAFPSTEGRLTGYYTLATSIEYQTLDVWREVAYSKLSSTEFERALNIVKDIPAFHENPLHLKEVWNGIKNGIKKAFNFTKSAINWGIQNGPMIATVAKGIASLV